MNWLRRIVSALIKARDADPHFPPMPLCLICGSPCEWLIVSKVWICHKGHRFERGSKNVVNAPARLPGDRGDNTDGQI